MNLASSAFSKAVGFKNVNHPAPANAGSNGNANDNPIFDTSQLNQAFSNNMGGNLNFNDLNREGTTFKNVAKEANSLNMENK